MRTAAAHHQHLDAIAPRERARLRRRRSVALHASVHRRRFLARRLGCHRPAFARLRRDGDERWRDRIVEALDGDRLNHRLVLERAAERPHLPTPHEVGHRLRSRHVVVAIVIRDLDAVLEGELLARAISKLHRRLGNREVLVLVVAAAGISPAADAAEEMQPAGLHVHVLHLDLLREVAGHAIDALEHDEIVSVQRLARAENLERHIARLDQAEFLELDRLGLRVAAAVDALGAVRREGRAQIDETILRVAAAHVGEHIAQRLRAERLEALGHQRATGVPACLDVGGFHRGLAAVVAERDRGLVFAGDRAVVGFAILRLDAPGDEARVHLAIRVENGHQQFRRAMRAHAGQLRSDFLARALELVAHRAVLREDRLALLETARLLNLGCQLGEERILFLRLGSAQFLDHFAGARGDLAVGMGAEPVDGGRPECGEGNLAGLQRLDESQRGVAPLDHLGEGGFLQFRLQLRISPGQLRRDGLVADAAHGLDDALLKHGGSVGAEQFAHGGNDVGVHLPNAQQAGRDLHARVGGLRFISQLVSQFLHQRLGQIAERTLLVPTPHQRQRRSGQGWIR